MCGARDWARCYDGARLAVKYSKVKIWVGKVSKVRRKEKFAINSVNFVDFELPGRPRVCPTTRMYAATVYSLMAKTFAFASLRIRIQLLASPFNHELIS
jgi:hypothetical protein